MKKFLKPAALLPVIIGVALGALFFMLGEADDAPGLSLIGFAAGFPLVMLGVYNYGVIKRGFLAFILLFCFGVGGILFSLVMLLDGEFAESPGLAFIGAAFGVVLIVIGAFGFRAMHKKCNSE